jgi:hypothetical protein
MAGQTMNLALLGFSSARRPFRLGQSRIFSMYKIVYFNVDITVHKARTFSTLNEEQE